MDMAKVLVVFAKTHRDLIAEDTANELLSLLTW